MGRRCRCPKNLGWCLRRQSRGRFRLASLHIFTGYCDGSQLALVHPDAAPGCCQMLPSNSAHPTCEVVGVQEKLLQAWEHTRAAPAGRQLALDQTSAEGQVFQGRETCPARLAPPRGQGPSQVCIGIRVPANQRGGTRVVGSLPIVGSGGPASRPATRQATHSIASFGKAPGAAQASGSGPAKSCCDRNSASRELHPTEAVDFRWVTGGFLVYLATLQGGCCQPPLLAKHS